MVEIQQTREQLIQEPRELNDQMCAAFSKEILETVKKLLEKRTPEPNSIPNAVIKRLPVREITLLTSITNAIFRLCHFLKPWKNADVVINPKQTKNNTFLESYRSVCFFAHSR